MTTEKVDHADKVTEKARQGTGPRNTVSVLLISVLMAGAAGAAILAYFMSQG